MTNFLNRLLDTILDFQRQVQENLMVFNDHQNVIHHMNESINADQINSQHHQALNDHLQFHQQNQHHEIHHTNHMDHMNHM